MSPAAFLMLGHGYSAAALAARLPGWRVQGTTRTPGATLGDGVVALAWSDAAAVEAAIAGAEAILVSIPPADGGDPALRRYGAALAQSPARWVGYLSTTAVYGDRQGGWVDEEGALAPVSERGRWRVAAEEAWRTSGLPVHLFRLAGIYGPGRSAFDKLREGRAHRVVKPGQVFSRIHVDDLATTLLASLERPNPGRAYNVADDEPAPPQDVIAHAAGLLGVPVPPAVPFAEAELSPMARSFYGESKRVANRRIKRELGVRLAFPDYRAGLAAILAAGF